MGESEAQSTSPPPPANGASMDKSEAQRPLYGRLMQAIDVQHTWGNRVGFFKLPLIMLDIRLYGGAIAQFYILTEALEAELATKHGRCWVHAEQDPHPGPAHRGLASKGGRARGFAVGAWTW